LGWSVGFTRTFFAVLSGFLAIFVSNKYSYGERLNLYLIFVITALFVIVLGCFIARFIKFLYMGILDRIGGLMLNACVWLILFVNVIVPIIPNNSYALDASNSTIYRTVSHIMQSKIPLFKKCVPPQFLNRSCKISKIELKNLNKRHNEKVKIGFSKRESSRFNR